MSIARIFTPPKQIIPTLPQLERKWIPYPIKPPGTTEEWFRVMHWNMLGDGVAPSRAFDGTPSDLLQWDCRRENVLHQLLTHDPDIISLVECNKSHFNGYLWMEMRRRGYGCLFTPSWKINGVELGNAIYYHKGRFFPLLMAGADTPTTYPWANHAVLRDKIADKNVVFLSCHFSEDVQERDQQSSQVVQAAAAMCKWSSDEYGVVICGDLNAAIEETSADRIAKVYSNAYDFIGPRYTAWKKRLATESTPHDEIKRTVDYIFAEAESLAIQQVLDVPADEAVGPERFPGTQFPSDHVSLVVDYAWRVRAKL
eukprot:PhM_4_TR18187/c0_g2_i1/m.82714/K18764/CCRN4L; nocturnin